MIRKIDGEEVTRSGLLPRFLQAGFATDYQGLIDVTPHGKA